MGRARLPASARFTGGGARAPATYDLGDENKNMGEHQDLTLDTATVPSGAKTACARMATCTVKGGGALSMARSRQLIAGEKPGRRKVST